MTILSAVSVLPSDFIFTIIVCWGNCPKNTFPVILMILVDVCLRIPRWNMMLNVPKYLHLYVYNVSVKYNIVHYVKKRFFIILFFYIPSAPIHDAFNYSLLYRGNENSWIHIVQKYIVCDVIYFRSCHIGCSWCRTFQYY